MENKMTKRSLPQSKKYKHKLGTLIKVGNQTIGQVYNGVFEKDVSSKAHFIHYPKEAIAFTITALHAAIRAGAEYVEVLDKDTGLKYKTTIQKYFEHGEKFNWNWGDQLKLTLPNFTQTMDPEYVASTSTGTHEYTEPDTFDVKPLVYKSHATKGVVFTPGIKQLNLFGGGK